MTSSFIKSSRYSVSIIVPIYNSQDTLKATLSSLVSQTLNDIEILCIDDGSTDNSFDIASSFSKENPKVKVYKTANNGSFLARSKGISIAQGEYIGFCDADDTAEPQMFEKLYKAAKDSNAEIASCAYYRKDGTTTSKTEMNHFQGVHCVDHRSGWLVSVNTSVWNKLIRSDIAKNHFIFNLKPRISEDALFLLSIYPNINKIVFLPEPLYNYNINNSTAMKSINSNDIKTIIESWKQERDELFRESLKSFIDIYDLAAFIHLGISLPLVLIETKSPNCKNCLKLLNAALDNYFSKYKNNRFLSFKYIFKNRNMMLLTFCAYAAKRCHILLPLLKVYYLLSSKLRFDFKW